LGGGAAALESGIGESHLRPRQSLRPALTGERGIADSPGLARASVQVVDDLDRVALWVVEVESVSALPEDEDTELLQPRATLESGQTADDSAGVSAFGRHRLCARDDAGTEDCFDRFTGLGRSR